MGALALGNCAVCGLRAIVDRVDDHGTPMALEHQTKSPPRPPVASYIAEELRQVTGKGSMIAGSSPRRPEP